MDRCKYPLNWYRYRRRMIVPRVDLIFGCGVLGLWLKVFLARTGNDVSLFDWLAEHLEILRQVHDPPPPPLFLVIMLVSSSSRNCQLQLLAFLRCCPFLMDHLQLLQEGTIIRMFESSFVFLSPAKLQSIKTIVAAFMIIPLYQVPIKCNWRKTSFIICFWKGIANFFTIASVRVWFTSSG